VPIPAAAVVSATVVALGPPISIEFPVQSEVRRDLAHLMPLIGKDEARGGPGGARSPGATGAMHVGLAILGRVEVDHVSDL